MLVISIETGSWFCQGQGDAVGSCLGNGHPLPGHVAVSIRCLWRAVHA